MNAASDLSFLEKLWQRSTRPSGLLALASGALAAVLCFSLIGRSKPSPVDEKYQAILRSRKGSSQN